MARPIPAAAAVIMTRCGMLFPFDLHDAAHFLGLLQLLVGFSNGGQRFVQVAAHGDNFSGLLVDMQLHDLVGGDEFLGLAVIHAVEEMHALFIAAQHLGFDGEGLAELSFPGSN